METKKTFERRDDYTPREMVEYLDRFIVGQPEARGPPTQPWGLALRKAAADCNRMHDMCAR